MKKLLRQKANFDILEGFLSELLKEDVLIRSILAPHSSKNDDNEKFNIVDILVEDSKGQVIIIELQYNREVDYFHRMLFATSKASTDYMKSGYEYQNIKKAINISCFIKLCIYNIFSVKAYKTLINCRFRLFKTPNMKTSYYSFALIISIFFACSEDHFVTIQDIELPEHEPVLGITAHLDTPINGMFPTFHINVAGSIGIIESEESKYLDNMEVHLFNSNGSSLGLDKIQSNLYYIPLSNNNYHFPLTPFEEYTLKVSHPEYPSIQATQKMPPKPEIQNASFKEKEVPIVFGKENYDLIRFDIRDKANETNYYGFKITYFLGNNNTTNSYSSEVFYETLSPLFEQGYRFPLLLSDEHFNGDIQTVNLIVSPDYSRDEYNNVEETLIHVELEVFNLTEDYFRYETSLQRRYQNEGNPFAEPNPIHSNIEGGFGIFTLFNGVKQRIK